MWHTFVRKQSPRLGIKHQAQELDSEIALPTLGFEPITF